MGRTGTRFANASPCSRSGPAVGPEQPVACEVRARARRHGLERGLRVSLAQLFRLQTLAAPGHDMEALINSFKLVYEGVRPREAAAIFDELDLAVLVPLVDRLRQVVLRLLSSFCQPSCLHHSFNFCSLMTAVL